MLNPQNFSQCIKFLHENNGFTYSPTLKNPSNGFMVSLKGYETVTDLKDAGTTFKKFVSKNISKVINENLYFGGWINNKNIYFDISKNFVSLNDALKFGIENNQLAIFDLSKGISIKLPTPQKNGTFYQQKAYIEQWIKNFVNNY